ncbi:P-loop containing nucleoside triphosphate hydrolase protein [Zalerion maritima]|uniref:P-loop containing nucleoside triphosphate hydrolase protein n=1 Tax=Zalerion maritima TaxID=339359 RepID=A0AAD5WQE2_9PEZI|nr:P-loop containing nucleoside triphosphate hydrolase protein [Zalerion maritima]
MDATGVVLGVAGLAGLFSTCVDCFHLIQRGCTFDRDYRILETKFDNQELRLCAWGRACGLISSNNSSASTIARNASFGASGTTVGSFDTVLDEPQLQSRVRATLECIMLLFCDEKGLRGRYGLEPCEIQLGSSGTAALDPTALALLPFDVGKSSDRIDGSEPTGSSSRPGAFFSWKRKQRSLGFRGSARWAICDREKFLDLVQHIKDFNDDLESMTRAMEIPWRQRIIVAYEVGEIEDMETLEEIEEAGDGGADVVSETASVRLEWMRDASSMGSDSIRAPSVRTTTSTITSRNAGSFVTAKSRLALSDDGESSFSILDEPLEGANEEEEPTLASPEPNVSQSRRLSGIFRRPAAPLPRYRCVALGDKGCHSTELFAAFTVKVRTTHYQPTQFKEYATHCSLDGTKLGLELWDTAGLEDFYNLRKTAYEGASIIILCLQTSLPAQQTTNSTLNKWNPELKELCPDIPIIVVGIDDPDAEDKQPVPGSRSLFIANPDIDYLDPVKEFEREALAKRINAAGYMRCDLRSRAEVNSVFELAARTVSDIQRPQLGGKGGRARGRLRRLSNLFNLLKPIAED